MKSPGFSKFRDLMDLWDQNLALNELSDKVNMLVNSPSFICFVEKGGDIYGLTEDGRVTLARLKTGDPDMTKGWEDDASFMGINLSKLVRHESSPQSVFSGKDIKKIKIIDKEKAEKKLFKQSREAGGGEPGSPHAAGIAVVIRKQRRTIDEE